MSQEKEWKGQSRGGILGYTLFNFVLKTFGLSFAYFVLYVVAFYFIPFAPKATRASYYHFRHIHQFSFLKTWYYIYLSYYRFGQTILDKVNILAGYPNKFTFQSDGDQHLRSLSEEGNGAVLISAHLGNWDIAGHFLKKLSTPVNVILLDAEHQQIKRYLDKVMANKSYKIIPIKADQSHLFKISKAVQEKEFLCVHGDRYVPENKDKAQRAMFMGKPALFPVGPFDMARRLGIPYTFVFAIKETQTHYHFFATPGKINTHSTQEILEDYIDALEKMLKKAPEQWFNYYNFWEKE